MPRASPPFCTYNIFSIPIFISIFLHTQIRWAEKSWFVFGLFRLNSGSSLLTCYSSEGNSCVSLFSLSADIQKLSCFALVSNQTLFTGEQGEQGRSHFTCFGNSLLQPCPDWGKKLDTLNRYNKSQPSKITTCALEWHCSYIYKYTTVLLVKPGDASVAIINMTTKVYSVQND